MNIPTTQTKAADALRPSDADPAQETRVGSPLEERTHRTLRVVLAAIIIALAVSCCVFHETFRAIEASATTEILRLLGGDTDYAVGTNFLIWPSPDSLIAINISLECSAVLLVVPVLILGAVLLASTRVNLAIMLIALTASIAVMLLVNLFRLAIIGWSTKTWGMDPGFEISHAFVGSIIGIVGFSAGLAVLLLIMGAGQKRRKQNRAK